MPRPARGSAAPSYELRQSPAVRNLAAGDLLRGLGVAAADDGVAGSRCGTTDGCAPVEAAAQTAHARAACRNPPAAAHLYSFGELGAPVAILG
jgi:hypothetical protein